MVAELDGEPAGNVGIWWRNVGRDRHIAWLFLGVRRTHWGKGVGSELVKEGTKVSKEMGCRRLVLSTIEGNERAIRLYEKSGFKTEAVENDEVFIDGSWRKSFVMGMELAPCAPKFKRNTTSHSLYDSKPSKNRSPESMSDN